MKVKTNVFFNGPHLEEELEAWINELKDYRIVTVLLTERPDEPQRVIARVVIEKRLEVSHYTPVDGAMLQTLRDDAARAHQEIGALVSVILEVYNASVLPSATDYAKNALVKTALSRCIETPNGKGVVVNLSKLLPPRG